MADSPKSVYFVILTWNSVEYIERCMASVLGLAGFDVHVHVVDNGSSDGTVAILDAYCEASEGRMEVTRVGVNLGTTVSRNIALRAVPRDADYVCVLDSDAFMEQAALEEMAAALEADPSIGLIGPSMRTSAGELQMSGRNLPTAGIKARKAAPVASVREVGARMEEPSGAAVDGLRDVPYLLSACWLMPWRTLDEVGLLDERIFYAPEDVDYCVRVHEAGRRVVLCERAEIVHEYQRISRRKLISKMNAEHVKGLAYYFRKHGYLFDSSKAYAEEAAS